MSAPAQESLGCLFVLFKLLGIKPPVPSLPYRQCDHFLSEAELPFYHALQTAAADRATVIAKVRVLDLLTVSGAKERGSYRNRISQKHVDFVICAPDTMKPLAAIELDDSSHERADRRERDEFMDQAFAAAELPLIHVPARASYDLAELAELLGPHLGASTAPAPAARPAPDAPPPAPAAAPAPAVAAPPMCPKCGVPLVLRTASRGDRPGSKFYGCPNYPRCRETRPVP